MSERVAFDLVTPERLLFSGEADMVVVPGSEGDFGVLPGHAPVISSLRPGALEIYEGDKATERYFVDGGYAEVVADRLTVVAEKAVPVAELDREVLEQRIRNAEEDLAEATDDEAQRKAQEHIDYLRDLLATLT